MDMAKWLNMWYDTYVAGSQLAQSTQAMYRRSINAVPDWLGALDLEDTLLPLHITRWLREVAAVHPRAAQLDRVMLARALRIAAKVGLCRSSIIDPDIVPKRLTSQNKRQY